MPLLNMRASEQLAELWWFCRSSRNDMSLTWSGLEGSSHSDYFVCRDVAGRTASNNLLYLFLLQMSVNGITLSLIFSKKCIN